MRPGGKEVVMAHDAGVVPVVSRRVLLARQS